MLVNGKPSAFVSAYDRGLAYGDGVFETIRVSRGQMMFLDQHLGRLRLGCQRLGIESPGAAELDADLDIACASAPDEAVIKIIVTRGEGERGYKPTDSSTTRVVSWSAYERPHGVEEGVDVWRTETRLAINPRFAGIKHLNRLEQVMAAAEIPAGFFEGLVCDMDGNPVECTRSNLFIVHDGKLRTPPVDRCGVDGVLRQLVIRDQQVIIETLTIEEVLGAEEAFVCNSVFGIMPVKRIAGTSGDVNFDVGSHCVRIRAWIEELGL